MKRLQMPAGHCVDRGAVENEQFNQHVRQKQPDPTLGMQIKNQTYINL
jgi:hypothetical protein